MEKQNMNTPGAPSVIPMSAGEDELSTLKEEAQRLKVPLSWLYSRTRIKDNGFPCIRVGKYIRVYHEEVMAWIEKKNEARG